MTGGGGEGSSKAVSTPCSGSVVNAEEPVAVEVCAVRPPCWWMTVSVSDSAVEMAVARVLVRQCI